MTDDDKELAKRIKELRFNEIFGLCFGLAVAIVAYPALPELGPGGFLPPFLIWMVVMAGYLVSFERKIRDAKRLLSSHSEVKP
jgi:uncharacterized membrane protein (DUF4010 family)